MYSGGLHGERERRLVSQEISRRIDSFPGTSCILFILPQNVNNPGED